MAGWEIKIVSPYRPCLAKGKKALFHCWEHRSEVVPPSPLRGGHSGGQISGTLAIVEFEDGSVDTVYPQNVTFLDTPGVMAEFEGNYYQKALEQQEGPKKENNDERES